MRVIYVSTEVFPALKTGGLADVNAALPKALRELGADVRLLLPAFPAIAQAAGELQPVAKLRSPVGAAPVRVLRGVLAGVPVYLIEAGEWFARPGNPYVDAHGADWPDKFFSLYGLEFYGKVNFMKAGLHYADRITTVSPSYAREIQQAEFGFGMDGLLRSRVSALSGILNGVDREYWNPQTDAHIAAQYDDQDTTGKSACKTALRNELGLAPSTGPLFGVVSRLTAQKGLDLVLEVLPELIDGGFGQQMIKHAGAGVVYRGVEKATCSVDYPCRSIRHPAVAARSSADWPACRWPDHGHFQARGFDKRICCNAVLS